MKKLLLLLALLLAAPWAVAQGPPNEVWIRAVQADGTGFREFYLADPGADRVFGWKDSEGVVRYFTPAEILTLIGVEAGATADQTDAEIETAYNAQVAVASQAEMEAGTETAIRRMTPEGVAQAIAALGGAGAGLTNWGETGTALRPNTAGFDLGVTGNEVGDITMNGDIIGASSVFTTDASIGAGYAGMAPTGNGMIVEGKTGIRTPTPGVALDINGRGRFLSSTSDVSGSGIGVEIQYLSSTDDGRIIAFDRDLSLYKILKIDSLDLVVNLASGGGLGVGTVPAVKLHSISTTTQFRAGFDASNWLGLTVGSTGTATWAGAGIDSRVEFTPEIRPNGGINIDSLSTYGSAATFTFDVAAVAALRTAASLADDADLQSHIGDTANPHGVTAEQAGAVPWHDAAVDPVVTDDLDNFSEGTIWRNNQGTSSEVDDTLFQLLDDTNGAAVWVPVVRLTAAGALNVSSLDVTGDLSAATLTVSGSTTPSDTTEGRIQWDTDDDRIVVGDGAAALVFSDDTQLATAAQGALADTAIQKETEVFMLTIDAIADSMDYGIGFVPAAFTVSEIRAVHVGTLATPDIDIDIRHSTDRSAAGNQVDTTAMTITSSTTGDSFTTGFEDATVPANSWIWVETSSISGTTDNLEVVVRGTYD